MTAGSCCGRRAEPPRVPMVRSCGDDWPAFDNTLLRQDLRSRTLLRAASGDYPATVPTAHVLDQEEWVFLQVALKDSFAFGSLRV